MGFAFIGEIGASNPDKRWVYEEQACNKKQNHPVVD
jgi:hypothetical protein